MDKAQVQKSPTNAGKQNTQCKKNRASKTNSQQQPVFNNKPIQTLGAFNQLTPAHLLHLQRTIGNQAVGRILHAKLTISHPDDSYEREADQVADKVMRMPEPVTSDEEEIAVQTKPLAGQVTPLVYRLPENSGDDEQQLVKSKQDESTEQDEENVVAPKPLIQRVPLTVREDDEDEKVAPKLEADANKEEEEKPLQTKLTTDIPLQWQAKEEEEQKEEHIIAAPMIHRQKEDENEEAIQTKKFPGADHHTPTVRPPIIHRTAASNIQRLCNECEDEMQQQGNLKVAQRKQARYQLHDDHDEEEQKVQPKGVQTHTPQVTTSIAANIHALNHGGSPLPKATRAFFEPRFGVDFSQVRVHACSRAAETAKSINARAFTVGNNISFGVGQFAPDSQEGRILLAHELTHVMQQHRAERSIRRQKLKEHTEELNKDALTQSILTNKRSLKLSFFDSESSDSDFFKHQAQLIADAIEAVRMPTACPNDKTKLKLSIGATGFSGSHILPNLKKAKICTGRKIQEFHIVSHTHTGITYGIGSAEAAKYAQHVEPSVRVIFHGCSVLDYKGDIRRLLKAFGSEAEIFAHPIKAEAGMPYEFRRVTLPDEKEKLRTEVLPQVTVILPKSYIMRWASDYVRYKKENELYALLKRKKEDVQDDAKEAITIVLKAKLKQDVRKWGEQKLEREVKNSKKYEWEREIIFEELNKGKILADEVQYWKTSMLEQALKQTLFSVFERAMLLKELTQRLRLKRAVKRWSELKLRRNLVTPIDWAREMYAEELKRR